MTRHFRADRKDRVTQISTLQPRRAEKHHDTSKPEVNRLQAQKLKSGSTPVSQGQESEAQIRRSQVHTLRVSTETRPKNLKVDKENTFRHFLYISNSYRISSAKLKKQNKTSRRIFYKEGRCLTARASVYACYQSK